MLIQEIIVISIHLCILCLGVSSSSSNFTDQSALLAFQSAINFDPTNTISGGNWTKGRSFCDWTGITCSGSRQRVTALELRHMGLQGTISPYVGNLSSLVILDLRSNSFRGPLPNEISNLFRLRLLILEANQLEGNVPASLYDCHRLEEISLSGNMLSGGIPVEFGTLPSLRGLYLDRNDLSGSLSSSLGNLSTLQSLNLSGNSLTGSIPLTILNISSLLAIDLHMNHLSGTLPSDFCERCPNIQKVILSDNQMSGSIPSGIANCKQLVILSLSSNSFQGTITKDIGNLQKLEQLLLNRNNLTGTIPSSMVNMSVLQLLAIEGNNIEGSIPSDTGSLPRLSELNLATNNLSGLIPPDLFINSTLQTIRLTDNSFSGSLPLDQPWHPNLEAVYMGGNQLGGKIPSRFSNFSKLRVLGFKGNFLTGPIPKSHGNLKFLQHLILADNQLTGEPGEKELTFLTALYNCRSLRRLQLDGNPLIGVLPHSVGNLSNSLEFLTASECGLTGSIPPGIGSLKNLTTLNLSANQLQGSIPVTIGGLQRLQRLYLGNNNIEGIIPEELCQLGQLGELSLAENKINGSIPSCIGDLSSLQVLLLSSNRLVSSVPMEIWSLKNLRSLNLSTNSLGGDLASNLGHLNVFENIDLSWNQIGGNIPATIGGLQSLCSLNLSNNLFEGHIPQSFGVLKALNSLDLSWNNLSGSIPKCLEELSYLRYLNLSFNMLSGDIPVSGPFTSFTAESFLGNERLCSPQVRGIKPCPHHMNGLPRIKLLLLILPGVMAVTISMFIISILLKYPKNSQIIPGLLNLSHEMKDPGIISHRELQQATNNFATYNFLGQGSSGSVYKGVLSDGTTVAVKLFNLNLEGAFKSFRAELKILRGARHRNLVKVICSCLSHELTALVLQYMPNGSLDELLHSNDYCLDLLKRVSIMFDVALALDYLHHGLEEQIVHCDLKPSNILLDEDMVAHVSDFGIAKILLQGNEELQTRTLGTLGYIAPEYGTEGKVSTMGDVYSYGILLMEMMTRRKPVDEMFSGDLSLKEWVSSSLPHNIIGILDGGLQRMVNEQDCNTKKTVILSILELAMECCRESPRERVDMKDVVLKLEKIKLELTRRIGMPSSKERGGDLSLYTRNRVLVQTLEE